MLFLLLLRQLLLLLAEAVHRSLALLGELARAGLDVFVVALGGGDVLAHGTTIAGDVALLELDLRAEVSDIALENVDVGVGVFEEELAIFGALGGLLEVGEVATGLRHFALDALRGAEADAEDTPQGFAFPHVLGEGGVEDADDVALVFLDLLFVIVGALGALLFVLLGDLLGLAGAALDVLGAGEGVVGTEAGAGVVEAAGLARSGGDRPVRALDHALA